MIQKEKNFQNIQKNFYTIIHLIDKLKQALTILFKLVVLDFYAFIKEKENSTFLDYKNFFKNKEFYTSLYTQILTDHKKSIVRHPDDSFECIYNKEQRLILDSTWNCGKATNAG